jgi:hypothetical protein
LFNKTHPDEVVEGNVFEDVLMAAAAAAATAANPGLRAEFIHDP